MSFAIGRAVVCAIFGFAVCSCAARTSIPHTQAASWAGAAAATIAVTIKNDKYSPKTVDVATGKSVVWTNKDGLTHTVSADDGSFDSGFLYQNVKWRHAFKKPGKYRYHCKIHPFMTGTIVVSK
ncbi:MAG: cupredoxin domain-containing protein [Candidatus Eremiobacteraeota bacterium]|nr:cupredoxin domain-containing protein [Candidatus Eremiobacteraeota bacterium]